MEKETKTNALPNNRDAEIAVLGAMLIDKNCVAGIQELLNPEDFYSELNQDICRAIYNLGKDCNLVAIDHWLKVKGVKEAGLVNHLAEIIEAVSISAGYTYYCRIIKEQANRRSLIACCVDTANRAYREKEDYEELLSSHKLDVQLCQPEIKQGVIDSRKLLKSTLDTIERTHKLTGSLTGITSGFSDIDWRTSGWQNGDLIILAGRPGSGKSICCKDFAERSGVPTLYFTLEMSAEQNQQRQFAGQSGVSFRKIRGAKMDEDDWEKVLEGADKISKIPIYYVDIGTLSIQNLINIIQLSVEKYGIKLVVIDYLQLIKKRSSLNNREQEVSDISRSLKATARDFNIPIICLAQLNRQCEQRDKYNKRPILSDLRESGSLEQDSDIVMFLYREHLYFKEKDEYGAELIFAKGRNIKVGAMKLHFDGDHQIFRDYTGVD